MRKSVLRAIKWLVLGAVVLFVAYGGWLYWLFHGGAFATSRFDSTAWSTKQTNESVSHCYRGGMAKHVKEQVLRPGLKREEVLRILGQPDFEKPDEVHYVLGMCSGLRIDFDGLHVYFNSTGELERVAILQH
jgi:outer membrane protein assembly factor BamE (lipoprotein component of BamABCDE complex)